MKHQNGNPNVRFKNEQTDEKSENTAEGKEDGAKDMDRNINGANIDSEVVQFGVGNEPAEDESLNHDDNGQEVNSQEIVTAQDSAYRTENDTDTLNERSESMALDDTQKDPDFNVEQEVQKNSDLTITADETNADEEEEHSQVTPVVESKSKKKKTPKKFVNKKPAAKYKPVHEDANENNEEDDFYYHCDKCSMKFTDWKELQKHKIDCVKVPRKFQCSKCNRGFQQKSMMDQHFDFYHTKNQRSLSATNTTSAMFTRNHMMNISAKITLMVITNLCVTIVVRDSSTKVNSVFTETQFFLNRKDYACNKCQERAFTSIGRLNAHLAICGKESKEQCGICGKMYSTKETLFTHIQEVHKEGHTRKCPFCDEKVYTSEGDYYKHMHVKHQISRNTIKLSEYMKAQDTENNENDEEQKDNSESDKKKKKPKKKKKKKGQG